MPFRLLPHTADVGIEATGATREEALGSAALGLCTILTGRGHPHQLGRPDRELAFAVEAPDLPALAVAFLSEVLWLVEAEDALWVGGGVAIAPGPDGTLRAEAKGNAVAYDPVRHGRGTEVKAVTYHGLEFSKPDGGPWRLRVYLDI